MVSGGLAAGGDTGDVRRTGYGGRLVRGAWAAKRISMACTSSYVRCSYETLFVTHVVFSPCPTHVVNEGSHDSHDNRRPGARGSGLLRRLHAAGLDDAPSSRDPEAAHPVGRPACRSLRSILVNPRTRRLRAGGVTDLFIYSEPVGIDAVAARESTAGESTGSWIAV